MKRVCCFLLLLLPLVISAQEKKSIEALYITTPVTIDGILDEPAYSQALPAKDFVQLMPYNGRPAYQPSEVYFLYDQTAIYVGARLLDSSPDSIFNFFSERDNIGASDYFGVYFDPYNQGQIAYGFFITPAGVQTDIKAIKTAYDNEDDSWDAVWQSKTKVTEEGWIVELRIPYSALRFPEDGGGTWGLNMFRNIKRYSSNASWSFIDRQVSGFIHQEGELTGIKNIKPPVRLSISPYAAAYSEFKGGDSSPEFTYKAGMDLKYGISESFTLDMMLIPDFGQIQSDDRQLNLSPYELFYSEKRQFFTEGTELFNRADIFYSRRIGTYPKFSDKAYSELKDNEIVDYNPTETRILNATKISGRTAKGWGLGLLNAMTLPSKAILKDTLNGNKREVLVQPFTNYNVAVVDKSLKNNSYISLINTNMLMANDPFSTNVTAADFQLRNKQKTYAISGQGGISRKVNDENETGFTASLSAEKNSGKLQFGISQYVVSDKFNPNDLGYLRRNNEMNTRVFVNYNIIEPFGIFKDLYAGIWGTHSRIYDPNTVSRNLIGFSYYNTFKNNYGAEVDFSFGGTNHDYYEPRVFGRYYTEPNEFSYALFANSDSRKPLRISLGVQGSRQPESDYHSESIFLYMNYRIGRRIQISYNSQIYNQINDRGFVDMTSDMDTIYFARRDVKTIENIIGASFALNNKAGFNFRMRHYWSGAANKEFFQLQENGTLVSDLDYDLNQDANYNAFNIDLVFRWIFAPGSEMSIAWKNSIYADGNNVINNYWKNLGNTWDSDQINSLSVKVLYYIDYNSLRKKK